MLCYAQTLVLEKIRSGELLYEALQKQKFERQQKRKNEMVEQRLCMKELKSNLSTGDMKGVFIYPLFFTEIDKKTKTIQVLLFRSKTETFIHTEDE